MKTSLKRDEKLIKEGKANLQKGPETVGGKLYLTDHRLIFETHKFNLQSGVTEIVLSDIQSVHLCWTKFLNLIPIFPNGLKIIATEFQRDVEYRFTLFRRQKWKNAIEEQKQKIEIGNRSTQKQPATQGPQSPPFKNKKNSQEKIECPSCGKMINSDSKYCTYCGTEI